MDWIVMVAARPMVGITITDLVHVLVRTVWILRTILCQTKTCKGEREGFVG